MTATAEQALQSRFVERWAALAPGVIATYDNQPAAAAAITTEYVRFTILPGASIQQSGFGATPGTRQVEQLGRAVIQCFVPRGTGTARLRELADIAASILELHRFDQTLRCGSAEISVIPSNESTAWQQRNVSVPWSQMRFV